jgi:hypothetical protein
VVGTEEVGALDVANAIDQIKAEYKDRVPEIWQFIHPKGLAGEMAGVASANRKWAAQHAVQKLSANGADSKNYIFTTFDADWQLHKEYSCFQCE